ncbi:uncharacterized protein LY89DRAFT_47057 [Mollisia scopiformis]|uniref:Uncharacterized protein n=1 Tax=Mollisia scopiformis TaxID=149040 RepID=A0A194XE00_MOLSC|nr:uncharacterized protein LY89DRAFT_47057 [Mollisia scopiformis]KUJ18376.1 hypothetical protein LY89DRAFT_47057 [Mollisia scopiformis]
MVTEKERMVKFPSCNVDEAGVEEERWTISVLYCTLCWSGGKNEGGGCPYTKTTVWVCLSWSCSMLDSADEHSPGPFWNKREKMLACLSLLSVCQPQPSPAQHASVSCSQSVSMPTQTTSTHTTHPSIHPPTLVHQPMLLHAMPHAHAALGLT